MSDELLDRAAQALRDAEAAAASDEAMITRALLAGRARQQRQTRVRRAWIAGGAALALAAVAVLFLLERSAPSPIAGPSAPPPLTPRAAPLPEAPPEALPAPVVRGDDRLTPTRSARFRLDFDDPARRVVTLTHGAMLFDLAPLPEGHAFAVRTAHLEALVTGTVFAVEARASGSAVEVFEGSVLVREGGRVRLLSAGQRHGVLQDGALRAAGEAAAEARGRAAPLAAAPHAAVPPAAVEATERPPARARRRAAADARRPPTPTPERARARIVEGHADEALAMARAAAPSPAWRYVEADALRALGRDQEAAQAYDAAADGLEGSAQREAALLAAQLHLRGGDAERALRSLEGARVAEVASPLRERALVLRAEALVRLERHDALLEVARAYLRLYPTGHRAAWMGRVVDGARALTPGGSAPPR
ncbi:MAG: FecR family protein [Myxococcota bacterium]|nr:FecR family protein [Myxococcota bacterium]